MYVICDGLYCVAPRDILQSLRVLIIIIIIIIIIDRICGLVVRVSGY
jgi:hypothetical protein